MSTYIIRYYVRKSPQSCFIACAKPQTFSTTFNNLVSSAWLELVAVWLIRRDGLSENIACSVVR